MGKDFKEPDFHAQADGDISRAEQQAWFARMWRKFKRRGAAKVRYAIIKKHWTVGPEQMLVADGWKKLHDEEAEPCVDLTYAQEGLNG